MDKHAKLFATKWKVPPTLEQKRRAVQKFCGTDLSQESATFVNSMFRALLGGSSGIAVFREKMKENLEERKMLSQKLATLKTKHSAHTLDEKRKLLKEWEGMDLANVAPSFVDLMFKNYFRSHDTAAKEAEELKKAIQQLDQTRRKLREEMKQFNNVNVRVEPHPKDVLVAAVYRAVPNPVLECNSGGSYAHLRFAALEKVLRVLRDWGFLDRESGFLDIGSGLNVPAWHCATKYCGWAAGIEIDECLCLQAATMSIQLLLRGTRNHRVALLCGDVLKCRPTHTAKVVYIFDLAFSPELYLEVMDWVAASSAECIVTFKAAREPSYLKAVTAILQAEEVARITGCHFSVSSEGCTAVVLRRLPALASGLTVVTPSPIGPRQSAAAEDMLDIDSAILPFFKSEETTLQLYKSMQASLAARLNHIKPQSKPRVLLLGMVRQDVPRKISDTAAAARYLATECQLLHMATRQGRDSLRIFQLLQDGYEVFTVSEDEIEGIHCKYHTTANFNTERFRRELRSQSVVFSHVILDWFWSPCGWTKDHWAESFFSQTIPSMATSGAIEVGGIVALPFQEHVIDMVRKYWSTLSKHYSITMEKKNADCSENILNVATQKVQHHMPTFGKSDNQMYYCGYKGCPTEETLTFLSDHDLLTIEWCADAAFLLLRRLPPTTP